MKDDTGISVTGAGRVTTTPDIARINFGVSVRGQTVGQASQLARDQAASLHEALVSAGVDKADIATTNFSVNPDYDHPKGKERLLGFRVSNDVRVTLRDLETVGATIDRAVEAAGDSIGVNWLRFELEDDTEARNVAREAAWEDARTRADHLAQLAGVSLGNVVRISESTAGLPAPRMMAAPMAAAESTPIEAGTTTLTVTLDVRFAIE